MRIFIARTGQIFQMQYGIVVQLLEILILKNTVSKALSVYSTLNYCISLKAVLKTSMALFTDILLIKHACMHAMNTFFSTQIHSFHSCKCNQFL